MKLNAWGQNLALACIAGAEFSGVLAGILWAATGILWNAALWVALAFVVLAGYLFERSRPVKAKPTLIVLPQPTIRQRGKRRVRHSFDRSGLRRG